jgi:hypothetical protein
MSLQFSADVRLLNGLLPVSSVFFTSLSNRYEEEANLITLRNYVSHSRILVVFTTANLDFVLVTRKDKRRRRGKEVQN